MPVRVQCMAAGPGACVLWGHVWAVALLFGAAAAQDAVTDKVYWAVYNTGKLQRASLDGSDVEDVRTVTTPQALVLDESRCMMYWADTSNEAIMQAPIDGTGSPNVFYDMSAASSHALTLVHDHDSGFLYWTDYESRIKRASIDPADANYAVAEELLTYDSGFWVDRVGLAVDSSVSPVRVYFVDSEEYRVSYQDWGTVEEDEELISPDTPLSLAFDSTSNQLYWSDWKAKIFRASTDGTGQEEVADTGQSSLSGLLLDSDNSHLYWVDGIAGVVYQADLEGVVQWQHSVQAAADGSPAKPTAVAVMRASRVRSDCFTTTTTTTTLTSTSTVTETTTSVTVTETTITATATTATVGESVSTTTTSTMSGSDAGEDDNDDDDDDVDDDDDDDDASNDTGAKVDTTKEPTALRLVRTRASASSTRRAAGPVPAAPLCLLGLPWLAALASVAG